MEFRFEPRPDHLLVEVHGAFSPADARAAIARITEACRETAQSRVLVDARGLSGPVSIAERFDLGAFFASVPVPVRFAVLVSPEQMFTKTLEDTVVNRGKPFRTTASLDEARLFLGI
jgi:hypothetical protein